MAESMWSPTKARLNRRRNKAAKLQLDLSAHIKGESAPLSDGNDKDPAAKAKADADLQKSIDERLATCTDEVLEWIDMVTGPDNKTRFTVRQRVEAEVLLNKDPDSAQLMRDIHYIRGRKSLLNFKAQTEQEQAKMMEELIQQEEEREKQEREELEQKRLQRLKEEQEAKERQEKALKDAKKKAAEERAKDAKALKELATKTKAKVEEKIETKIKEEKDREEMKKEILSSEENDVIRALKEARLDQKDISTI